MDDMEEILQEFLVESYENLDQLDRDLVALEQDPDSRALLSNIFRVIHTIKGTSEVDHDGETRSHDWGARCREPAERSAGCGHGRGDPVKQFRAVERTR